jgi:hypothetical protein
LGVGGVGNPAPPFSILALEKYSVFSLPLVDKHLQKPDDQSMTFNNHKAIRCMIVLPAWHHTQRPVGGLIP